MDYYEKKMIEVVNRNYDCKVLADKLNAISARRHRKRCFFSVFRRRK